MRQPGGNCLEETHKWIRDPHGPQENDVEKHHQAAVSEPWFTSFIRVIGKAVRTVMRNLLIRKLVNTLVITCCRYLVSGMRDSSVSCAPHRYDIMLKYKECGIENKRT